MLYNKTNVLVKFVFCYELFKSITLKITIKFLFPVHLNDDNSLGVVIFILK